MGHSRRDALLALAASAVLSAQDPQTEDPRHPHLPRDDDEDKKLPNGKSQKDEIAKQDHKQALQDSATLLQVAQDLHDELQHAGDYVVAVASVKKTEEIEKLARRIRAKLKA